MDSGLLKRLGWYLLGFSIGLVFLVFFVKKKSNGTGIDFCYFPNCRVLKDLRSKPIVYSGDLGSRFSKDSVLWYSFFKEGRVDFDKSDTETKPCKTYRIENNENKRILIKNCPEKVLVESLQ